MSYRCDPSKNLRLSRWEHNEIFDILRTEPMDEICEYAYFFDGRRIRCEVYFRPEHDVLLMAALFKATVEMKQILSLPSIIMEVRKCVKKHLPFSVMYNTRWTSGEKVEK